jgi:hypothetical protein
LHIHNVGGSVFISIFVGQTKFHFAMSPIIDLGYTGSNFSVEREFSNIKNQTNDNNVFVTDVDDIKIIKFKFVIKNDPRKSYCQDINKIIELKNKLIRDGFIDKGSTLLNQNGNFHYLYVF